MYHNIKELLLLYVYTRVDNMKDQIVPKLKSQLKKINILPQELFYKERIEGLKDYAQPDNLSY